jgi:hypothetical protein
VILNREVTLHLFVEHGDEGFVPPPAGTGYEALRLGYDDWEIEGGRATTRRVVKFVFSSRAGRIRGWALTTMVDGRVVELAWGRISGGPHAIHKAGDAIPFRPELSMANVGGGE